MRENFRIPIIKHLEDKDDLFQGRDAELVPGQEGEALSIAESLDKELSAGQFDIAIFAVSPKNRARQTASIVQEMLSKIDPNVRIIQKIEQNLREIDQGSFILPQAYEAGDSYEGLKIAGKIFSQESFNSEDASKDNLLYRFGDPVIQSDGTWKYPELVEYFSSPGESYRDVLVRLYSQVIVLSKEMSRFADKALPIVFTHGQPHQIFTDLSNVAELIVTENLKIGEGGLPRICWNLYQERRKGVVPYGKTNYVSVQHLDKPELLTILERELIYLQSL